MASAKISSCVDLDEALCGLGPFVVSIEAVTLSGCYLKARFITWEGGGMNG